MTDRDWGDVDAYIQHKLMPDDPVLAAVLSANQEAGLPAIDVSPAQGQFLRLLAEMTNARRILEIGTLGAYSSICMARALPEDGKLVSLEYEARHAEVARANIGRAGLGDRIDIIVGAATDSLARLDANGEPPFDFVFIDADKPNNPAYLEWAIKLSRPGAIVVCDNVIRDGDVIDEHSRDDNVKGARAAFDFIADRPHLRATALQTVGAKGYDGMIIMINRPIDDGSR